MDDSSDGYVDILNGEWLEYTGVTAEQASGFQCTSAVHPDDFSGLGNYWQSLVSSGQAGQFEARLRRLDGVYRWFLFQASPMSVRSGHIVNWYGTKQGC
ncbi:MAG TPA: PAS domain-containing protein [Bryobacteraceae bacterium]|nr:PAS domain-containing protein [Bryobacteraceae bacterium]